MQQNLLGFCLHTCMHVCITPPTPHTRQTHTAVCVLPPFRAIAHRSVVPDVLFLFGVIISYDGHLCKRGCQCHISLLIVLSHTFTQSLSLPSSLTLSFPRARASAHAFFLSLARSCSSRSSISRPESRRRDRNA